MVKNQTSKRFFLNWHQMGKVIRNMCWHQTFVPKGLSVPALGLYTCIKSFKMCLKSYFQEFVLKLATNGQSDKGFLLISTFVPKVFFSPCLGAIYMYKSIKIYTRTRCQVSVYRITGPLVWRVGVVSFLSHLLIGTAQNERNRLGGLLKPKSKRSPASSCSQHNRHVLVYSVIPFHWFWLFVLRFYNPVNY